MTRLRNKHETMLGGGVHVSACLCIRASVCTRVLGGRRKEGRRPFTRALCAQLVHLLAPTLAARQVRLEHRAANEKADVSTQVGGTGFGRQRERTGFGAGSEEHHHREKTPRRACGLLIFKSSPPVLTSLHHVSIPRLATRRLRVRSGP